MKSGFIAIIGSPNVGKSSLLNVLIGQKVSIVSPKAQTTRDRIMGILTEGDTQMVFVDTPGTVRPGNKLGEYMDKCIKSAKEDCDAIVVVMDANRPILTKDVEFIQRHLSMGVPVFVALNKVDLVGFERVYPILEKLSPLVSAEKDRRVSEIIPISCKTKKNISVLKGFLVGCLKDGAMYFDPEDVSDKSVSFLAGEIIREKTLWLLQDEIPHGIGVLLQNFEVDGEITRIEADIVCEKSSHKEIIIGKDGAMLKEIGTRARIDIEKLVDGKVFLKLFVKVRTDWRKKGNILADLGYEV